VTSFLIVDIETVPDPELSAGLEEGKVPSPPHHEVVAIGALLLDSSFFPKRLAILEEGKGERAALTTFAKVLAEHRPTVVTFNGRGFDMPVIAARCLRRGVPFKGYYGPRDMRYRFTDAGHFDVMDYLSDFGASKASKLDVIARLCGMPGKVGVSGADVAGMVAAGKLSEVGDYCLCDVVQTAAVFMRLQYVRGVVTRETYYAGVCLLLKLIGESPRLAALRGLFNEKRLLLEEEP
jgi:3'-5' exonuclease